MVAELFGCRNFFGAGHCYDQKLSSDCVNDQYLSFYDGLEKQETFNKYLKFIEQS